MKRIILMTHGKFGEELIKSAEMIIGKLKQVSTFSLTEDEGTIEFIQRVRTSVQDDEELLILVDLFGGTPFHAASYLFKSLNASVVTGLSLPLLLEAYMSFIQGDEFELEALIETGKDAIKNISEEFKERREVNG